MFLMENLLVVFYLLKTCSNIRIFVEMTLVADMGRIRKKVGMLYFITGSQNENVQKN